MKTKKILALISCFIMTIILMPNHVFAETVEVDTEAKLSEALEAGNSVKLTANIPVGEFTGSKFTIAQGQTITIDLNGYTISGKNSDENVSTSLFTNKGTLTIEDSSSAKTGKMEMSDTEVRLYKWAYGMFVICNTGDLTINGGSLINTGKTDVAYAVDNNSTSYDVKLTINNGTLKGIAAVRAFANSTTKNNDIIINNGHLEGTSTGVWLQQSNGNAQKASLTVNGGVIIGVGYPGVYADINNDKGSEVVSMTFNGGEIRNNSENYGAITFFPRTGSTLANATINLKITDAVVINENSNSSALYFDSTDEFNTDNIIITGGTYSTDVKDFISAEFVSKKIGDNYVVGVEKDVNITASSNGTVTVDKNKAVEGETVTITSTPKTGYEITTLKVVDKDNKEIEVNNNTFTMPNSSVTITAEFSEVTTTTDIPVLDPEEEVEEVVVGATDTETIEEVLLDSLLENEELAEIAKDTSVKVELEIEEIDTEVLDEEVKKEIEKIEEDLTITSYFDITVAVKNANDGSMIDTIAELTEEIELMVSLPEKLQEVKEGYTRKFYIVRVHEGKTDLLEADLSKDGKYLTFKTDKFSTYALAYEDIEEATPPKTGDNVTTYILIGFISVIVFAGLSLYLKKRFN